MPRLALALAFILAACTQVPELGAVVPPDLRAADYPQLIPLGPELTTPADPATEGDKQLKVLTARAEALQRRARALARTEVVDEATRERMRAGVDG